MVVQNYLAQPNTQQLGLNLGDVIRIDESTMNTTHPGWCRGTNEWLSLTGWFPLSCVIVANEQPHQPHYQQYHHQQMQQQQQPPQPQQYQHQQQQMH